MRLAQADLTAAKGWYAGPWNSDLPIAIGYANAGIDEPHVHSQLTEIYLVARGTSEIRVEQETITLRAGDMITVEPGEAHTFFVEFPRLLSRCAAHTCFERRQTTRHASAVRSGVTTSRKRT